MLERFMENCKKPAGRFGRLVLKGMNCGHGAVANWAFDRICWPEGGRILDVGCGGGGNIARLLKRCPHSRVDGVDYAPQSVEVSRQVNVRYLGGRCRVEHGDVMALPFENESYDVATAVETVYFWPDLTGGLGEIRRILRPGGHVLLVTEMSDPAKGEKWSRYCSGMTIYTPTQLRAALEQAGFVQAELHTRGVWTAAVGKKPDKR